jgi:hypothetical protein
MVVGRADSVAVDMCQLAFDDFLGPTVFAEQSARDDNPWIARPC